MERRHAELDRVERRLDALHAVRWWLVPPPDKAHAQLRKGGVVVCRRQLVERVDGPVRGTAQAGTRNRRPAAAPPQVRPAHSAEAEALEGQLAELYQAYLHM